MLIDFFSHLRRHKLPCSLRELLDLHGALAAGLASVDMDDFYRLSRSLLVKDGQVSCWGGGGIVADSDWQAEYQESITKVKVLLDTLEGL